MYVRGRTLKELKRLNDSNCRLEEQLERIMKQLKLIDKHIYLYSN